METLTEMILEMGNHEGMTTINIRSPTYTSIHENTM